jgi:tRNA U34 5-carboxymethylaminomethyl modifying GTPase MnmE/TrmE
MKDLSCLGLSDGDGDGGGSSEHALKLLNDVAWKAGQRRQLKAPNMAILGGGPSVGKSSIGNQVCGKSSMGNQVCGKGRSRTIFHCI